MLAPPIPQSLTSQRWDYIGCVRGGHHWPRRRELLLHTIHGVGLDLHRCRSVSFQRLPGQELLWIIPKWSAVMRFDWGWVVGCVCALSRAWLSSCTRAVCSLRHAALPPPPLPRSPGTDPHRLRQPRKVTPAAGLRSHRQNRRVLYLPTRQLHLW